MKTLNSFQLLNVGSGEEITIKELAVLIKKIIGYQGKLIFDEGKPDGTPRKLLDSKKIRELGWEPRITLEQGILRTYEDFLTSTNRLER